MESQPSPNPIPMTETSYLWIRSLRWRRLLRWSSSRMCARARMRQPWPARESAASSSRRGRTRTRGVARASRVSVPRSGRHGFEREQGEKRRFGGFGHLNPSVPFKSTQILMRGRSLAVRCARRGPAHATRPTQPTDAGTAPNFRSSHTTAGAREH